MLKVPPPSCVAVRALYKHRYCSCLTTWSVLDFIGLPLQAAMVDAVLRLARLAAQVLQSAHAAARDLQLSSSRADRGALDVNRLRQEVQAAEMAAEELQVQAQQAQSQVRAVCRWTPASLAWCITDGAVGVWASSPRNLAFQSVHGYVGYSLLS